MTEIESLNRMQWEKADLGNCKSCKKTLKTPIYQYYHNQLTGENYKSGPITSIDEYGRYRLLATCRQRADASIERAPFGALKEETFCIECYEDRGTKLGAIQLHLVTDSVNAELDRYVAQLPDLSNYPRPSSFDEGFFGLGDGYGYDMQDSLDIAFAGENEIFDECSQKSLDDLLNNFIKEKGRRYPNDQELAAWLHVNCVRFPDASCKIFDMRGMNYVLSDLIRRFVVIVHLHVDKWARFSVPAEYQ